MIEDDIASCGSRTLHARTSIMPHRRAPNLALVAALGLVGALTVYAAVSALAGHDGLAEWRAPLASFAVLWLAAALVLPLMELKRREPVPRSGDLGCLDRF
jgi:hypothetical protein